MAPQGRIIEMWVMFDHYFLSVYTDSDSQMVQNHTLMGQIEIYVPRVVDFTGCLMHRQFLI